MINSKDGDGKKVTEEDIDEGKLTGIFSKQRTIVQAYLNHLIARSVIILLIITDIALVITAVSLTASSDSQIDSLDKVSLGFNLIFFFELCLRIFVELHTFFKSWLNLLDGIIIVVSLMVSILILASEFSQLSKLVKLIRIVRIFLLVRSIRILLVKDGIQKSMRLIVGKNKRRYQKDGYDLDLCYITKRVISMSYPSSGLEGTYRNKIQVVEKFLDEKHPNKYKVYNLCSEKSYESSFFHGRAERYMIDDHNVPTCKEIIRFANDTRSWMTADPNNVIAVHCKGGKGRTGTMICIWLIESGECKTAQEALSKFGDRRTNWDKGKTFQGVETPSQSRFVGFFEIIKHELGGRLPSICKLRLDKIIIKSIQGVGNGDGSDFSLNVYRSDKSIAGELRFGSNENCKCLFDSEANQIVITEIDCEILSEEVKFIFYSNHKNVPKFCDCAFSFFIHTSFIHKKTNNLLLRRNELDNLHRSKTWNIFKEGFCVELFFSDPWL